MEEAGELQECQAMASLSSPNLEHVILIGDHKQLRPKINSYNLVRYLLNTLHVTSFTSRLKLPLIWYSACLSGHLPCVRVDGVI